MVINPQENKRGREEKRAKKRKTIKKMSIGTYILIIT